MPPPIRHRGTRKAPSDDPVPSADSAAAGVSQPEDAAARPVAQPGARGPRGDRPTMNDRSKMKVGFYQAVDDTARARAAYDWTRPQEGHRSFSDFVAAAVMREVARLEGTYHGGQPWPAVEPGQLPTGKPLGA